jgi:uncharacterized membrane protein YhaH (DUF805 family)
MFSFWGRTDLRAYWTGGMAALVLGYLGYMATLAPDLTTSGIAPVLASLGWPLMIVALFCSAALNVKRLHDRGRSGWFTLVLIGPLYSAISYVTGYGALDPSLSAMSTAIHAINFVIAVVFAFDVSCQTGDAEPNKYDEEPDLSFIADFVNNAFTTANTALSDVKSIAKDVSASAQNAHGAPAAPPPSSFANVEAALERAIAAQKETSAPVKTTAAPQTPAPAPSAPAGAPKSFGRRS